jgi:hypothetical protein
VSAFADDNPFKFDFNNVKSKSPDDMLANFFQNLPTDDEEKCEGAEEALNEMGQCMMNIFLMTQIQAMMTMKETARDLQNAFIYKQ